MTALKTISKKFILDPFIILIALLAVATGLVSAGCDSGTSSSATATPITSTGSGGASNEAVPSAVPTSEGEGTFMPGDQPTTAPAVGTPPANATGTPSTNN